MSYLAINGYAVPVQNGSTRDQREEIGGRSVAVSGGEISDIRAFLRVWQVRTPPLRNDLARALVGLVQGEGHTWDFEDATDWEYSSKGLGVDSSSGASRSTVAPRFGSACLRLAATTGSFAVDPQLGSDWTVIVSRDTGSGYGSYIETSTGYQFLDGVATSSEGWISVASGVVTISNTTGSTVDFDDFVVLPYAIPAEMAAAFGVNTVAFSALPSLTCVGDFAGTDTVECIGRDVDATHSQGVVDGVWRNNLLSVSFRLREESATQGAGLANSKSLDLDGVDEYLTSAHSTDFASLTAFSFIAWLYVDTLAAGKCIFSKWGHSPANNTFTIGVFASLNDEFECRIAATTADAGSNYGSSNNANISAGQWYMLGVRYLGAGATNADRLRMFLGDVDAATFTELGVNFSGTIPASCTAGTAAQEIGRKGVAGQYFGAGNLDELVFWTGANTPEHFEGCFNLGVPLDPRTQGNSGNIISWWRADGDVYPTVVDVVSGHNMTMTNMESGDLSSEVP